MSRKDVYEEDDGKVVSPMNLEGMPWYQRKLPGSGGGGSHLPAQSEKMTNAEKWAFFTGVFKATMLVSLAFGGGLGLFILIYYLIL